MQGTCKSFIFYEKPTGVPSVNGFNNSTTAVSAEQNST